MKRSAETAAAAVHDGRNRCCCRRSLSNHGDEDLWYHRFVSWLLPGPRWRPASAIGAVVLGNAARKRTPRARAQFRARSVAAAEFQSCKTINNTNQGMPPVIHACVLLWKNAVENAVNNSHLSCLRHLECACSPDMGLATVDVPVHQFICLVARQRQALLAFGIQFLNNRFDNMAR